MDTAITTTLVTTRKRLREPEKWSIVAYANYFRNVDTKKMDCGGVNEVLKMFDIKKSTLHEILADYDKQFAVNPRDIDLIPKYKGGNVGRPSNFGAAVTTTPSSDMFQRGSASANESSTGNSNPCRADKNSKYVRDRNDADGAARGGADDEEDCDEAPAFVNRKRYISSAASAPVAKEEKDDDGCDDAFYDASPAGGVGLGDTLYL
jgi:hypothetical protein